MKKFTLGILICIMALGLFACKDKKEEVEYNDTEGVASGKVELSGDDPRISISNIKAKVGTDIDYLSGVVVEDEEKFEDLKVWIDASAVDIDEPGDYKAKYTFEYDGKSVEHYITVTIIEGAEESAGDSAQVQSSATNNGDNQEPGNNAGANDVPGNNGNGNDAVGDNNGSGNQDVTTQNVVDNNDGNNQPTTTKKPDEVVQPTTTKKQDGVVQPSTTKKQNVTTQPTTTKKQNVTTQPTTTKKPTTTTANNGGDASSETTRKQLITSSGNSTTEIQNIGYSYIQLLSGSTVSIKSTTAKYILSTRTDVSYIEKNGVKYKVSKLIITYNTGDERTLETVEEKCN